MIKGCGIGLRESFYNDIANYKDEIDFIEVVPENSMHLNYAKEIEFRETIDNFSVVAHGLSLSLGDSAKLNIKHLKSLKSFLDRYNIKDYSEHLSFTSLNGKQSYELLPLPMTPKMVKTIVDRVDTIQNILKRELIIENPSYYYQPESTIEETDFINQILKKSGAKLLLDINNVFVNSHNHKFNPYKFIDKIDLKNISYLHVAGHLEYRDNLFIDTHGMPVKKEVWNLLEYILKKRKFAVLLERDNNIPPLHELIEEFRFMKRVYDEV